MVLLPRFFMMGLALPHEPEDVHLSHVARHNQQQLEYEDI